MNPYETPEHSGYDSGRPDGGLAEELFVTGVLYLVWSGVVMWRLFW
jgi:hypothetical protein